jgi:hypothetical protein
MKMAVTILAATVVLCAGTGRAGTLYSESGSGDLSNNQAAPNAVTAATGVNALTGTVGGGDSQDWIAITVPAGNVLSSLVLSSYTSTDAQGFMGVQAGSSFVGNPQTATPYLGYTHWGTGAQNGALAPTNLVGVNLLPLMGDKNTISPGSQGFTPPLGAGTYTFLFQQLGASTSYQFDFTLTAVPEPGTVRMMAAAGLLLFRRKRGSLGRCI